MKPTFYINRLGAQDKQPTVDTFITQRELDDICMRIIGNTDYDVVWSENRIVGRLITLETDETSYYISLSMNGELNGRNPQFQSIPTAYSQFLFAQNNSNKECRFYFYFLPQHGNNRTDYLKFIYRVMATIGIDFLNREYGLLTFVPKTFSSVKDLINSRNESKSKNLGNKSTYVTDEGTCYHIYGKTFGANQKETTLFCLALSAITDKSIKLFQIMDNDSVTLSENDINAIYMYSSMHSRYSFEIMDDTYEFDDGDSDPIKDKLRSPKFIYNLLCKFNGEKKCVLCDCKIEEIIQAAHIYPVASIRKRTDLDFDHKLELATDGDNGIWLCKNHHELFDRGLIWFENGHICISNSFDSENKLFVNQITTHDTIEMQYINEKMLSFFALRDTVVNAN